MKCRRRISRWCRCCGTSFSQIRKGRAGLCPDPLEAGPPDLPAFNSARTYCVMREHAAPDNQRHRGAMTTNVIARPLGRGDPGTTQRRRSHVTRSAAAVWAGHVMVKIVYVPWWPIQAIKTGRAAPWLHLCAGGGGWRLCPCGHRNAKPGARKAAVLCHGARTGCRCGLGLSH
jgi:hypothetical protein